MDREKWFNVVTGEPFTVDAGSTGKLAAKCSVFALSLAANDQR